jgi:hypothetical protein
VLGGMEEEILYEKIENPNKLNKPEILIATEIMDFQNVICK